MKKSLYTYKIYVEGGFHDETTSRAKALRLREKFEKEGWNVKIIRFSETILGPMGVEV